MSASDPLPVKIASSTAAHIHSFTMLKYLVLLTVCSSGYNAAQSKSYVQNLIGLPDYRKVQLHWESNKVSIPSTANFQIRYCELQSWGAQRCRTKSVEESLSEDIASEPLKTYTTDIDGLRMATTYSFEVRLRANKTREDRSDGDDHNENIIVIPTKGFSAKATQCLPQASEIEVATGPHFAGRIAVEATDGERCAIDGEPQSARDTYTLRINHEECGSAVNETTVATFVLVQENLPILTHSTRRFLVLCTYQPETLTVRAGLNLPNRYGHGKVTLEEDNGVQEQKGRSGRLLHQPQALIHQGGKTSTKEDAYYRLPLVLVILLMLIAVVVVLMELVRQKMKKRQQDEAENDFESITSTSTAASLATIS